MSATPASATAERLTSIESAALQRGAVDFVTKPLVPETFVARVRSHLRAREFAEQMHQSLAGAQIYSAPNQTPSRLLIFDDDVGAITLLQRTLSELGTIHYATTGAEALRLSHEIRPDLVILDVHMPGLDGFSVCAALKAQQEFKHVPVVFVTRFSDAANEARALELGAADFIRKPIESNVLRARIRNLLALKARVDSELGALSEHWRRFADSRVADVIRIAGDGVVSCDASDHICMVEGAQQAQHLMNDLMDWSRQEAGKLSVELGPVDAEAALRRAVESVQPMAQRVGIELIVCEVANTEPVLADKRRLVQCITNLLTNAIKYNRKGGSVRIELSRRGSDVRIDVRDYGIGMTTAQLSQLFEPFNRFGLENSALPGAGLGLVITKGLIEAMLGSLLVESVPGHGACFSVVLRPVSG